MTKQRALTELSVRAVMTREVITVEPEFTLRDLIDTLSAHQVSGAPVVSGQRVVGVISITDVLDFLSATPLVPIVHNDFREWGEIEERADDSPDGISRAYYTDPWEIARGDAFERFDALDAPEWDLLEEHTVGSIMSRKIEQIAPDESVLTAARHLLATGVHRLIVVGDGGLEGILSATDFVRLVAQEYQ